MTMCAVCRRNLLAGESYRYWRARRDLPSGRVVCFLCESEAARAGWMRDPRRPSHENAVGLRNSVRRVA
ncbi:MAG TPA: hypothetical protein VN960_05325 [Gaiellaceae bacterium]|nr:hypothetical protein [Gaiellaceae bacterium]